jgi:DNA-binding MarR family transcriptional regulator
MYTTELEDRQRTVMAASESSLAHLVAQHGMRALSRRLNDALRPVGITFAQFCLLSILYRGDPPTVKELAEKIKMDRMNVSTQVSLLVRRNMVTSETSRDVRNRRRLRLTALGASVLIDALPLWQKAEAVARHLFDHVDLEYLSTLATRDALFGEATSEIRDEHEYERYSAVGSEDDQI